MKVESENSKTKLANVLLAVIERQRQEIGRLKRKCDVALEIIAIYERALKPPPATKSEGFPKELRNCRPLLR